MQHLSCTCRSNSNPCLLLQKTHSPVYSLRGLKRKVGAVWKISNYIYHLVFLGEDWWSPQVQHQPKQHRYPCHKMFEKSKTETMGTHISIKIKPRIGVFPWFQHCLIIIKRKVRTLLPLLHRIASQIRAMMGLSGKIHDQHMRPWKQEGRVGGTSTFLA